MQSDQKEGYLHIPQHAQGDVLNDQRNSTAEDSGAANPDVGDININQREAGPNQSLNASSTLFSAHGSMMDAGHDGPPKKEKA